MRDWDGVWTIRAPEKWPDVPTEMTYSTFRVIERCPRSWSLAAAKYPETWERDGYPSKVGLSALSGMVIHAAVETIARALTKVGCFGLDDPRVPHVMRELGGHSRVISAEIDRALEKLKSNPRMSSSLDYLETNIKGRMGDLRAKVQGLLRRIRFDGHAHGTTGRHISTGPLVQGSFAELTLRCKPIGWKGTPDLLMLAANGCEIYEFKSGMPLPDHPQQLLTYAAIWAGDSERNPSGNKPAKLTLVYSNNEINVPVPSSEGLSRLQEELREKKSAMEKLLVERPPVARPSAENCGSCSVRHLCDEYWRPNGINASVKEGYIDLQARIVGEHGATSWNATTEAGPMPIGSPILIRANVAGIDLKTGTSFRIIDAWKGSSDDRGPYVSLGQTSEVFAL